MPEYRRHRMPGATYFVTLALTNRRNDLLVREIEALRAAVVRTRQLYPFQIDAWVVLPEHMHAVWTLPDGDADYSLRWTFIKSIMSISALTRRVGCTSAPHPTDATSVIMMHNADT